MAIAGWRPDRTPAGTAQSGTFERNYASGPKAGREPGGGDDRSGEREAMRQLPHPSWVWVQGCALVAAVSVAVVAGATRDHSAASADVPAAVAAVSPADTQRTYQADCAVCHGAAGRGTAAGPPIAGAGRASVDYYLSTGRMPLVSQSG